MRIYEDRSAIVRIFYIESANYVLLHSPVEGFTKHRTVEE